MRTLSLCLLCVLVLAMLELSCNLRPCTGVPLCVPPLPPSQGQDRQWCSERGLRLPPGHGSPLPKSRIPWALGSSSSQAYNRSGTRQASRCRLHRAATVLPRLQRLHHCARSITARMCSAVHAAGQSTIARSSPYQATATTAQQRGGLAPAGHKQKAPQGTSERALAGGAAAVPPAKQMVTVARPRHRGGDTSATAGYAAPLLR